MTDVESFASLVRLTKNTYAWVQSPHGHDRANSGVIVDDDGLTLIDTLMTASQTEPLEASLERFGVPVKRVVYTSSHIEFVGGSPAFWMAARYGRTQTSVLLDQPANIETLGRLHRGFADEFDALLDRPTRPVSHTVDVSAYLTESHLVIPTSGQANENLVVFAAMDEVLFAGAMCSFGVTPNAFDGDPIAWADALGTFEDLASVIVPGIGPVGGIDDVAALQAYLYACAEAEGDPNKIPAGPWDRWSERHLDEVNVERAAMLANGEHDVPPSMLRLIGRA